jgi:hypothetical protein
MNTLMTSEGGNVTSGTKLALRGLAVHRRRRARPTANSPRTCRQRKTAVSRPMARRLPTSCARM